MTDRLRIAGELGSQHGAAAVLIANPANRRWLGQSDAEGEVLILSSGVVAVHETGGSTDLRGALRDLGLDRGALLAADKVFGQALPEYPCVDLSEDLAVARMSKDESEVELVAAAASLASAGQERLREASQAGVSELELWALAKSAMIDLAGGEIETFCDLLVGARSGEVDGAPGEARIKEGDPVLFDLAPMRDGYWADSCATFAVGSPSLALRSRHDAVRSALEAGIAAARPGISAGRLDSIIRDPLHKAGLQCPHHTGHGVGAAAQEPPWLVPSESTILEQGMTIAIEPGAYGDGFGVRLEHLVLIENDGARPLTTHSLDLTCA